ncbi:MAG: hypothetical protein J4F36_09890 [Nitrosopumilaceae archaeon]|nr:hypothetical protein [Nitrosopumilaceae archaeon]
MKTRLLIILAIVSVSIFGFFIFTPTSVFDFFMACPENYYAENLFCYPDNTVVDTAAGNWVGRFMMINDPIIFDQRSSCDENAPEIEITRISETEKPSRLVFFVNQNTTAHVCIKYSSSLDDEGMFNLNQELDGGYLVTSNGTKSNVSVTPNPSLVPRQNGQTTIVDYEIFVPHDADGVYWLGLSQMCDRIPIVTSNHKIVPNDISVMVGLHGCPAIFFDAEVIGYSNADAQHIVAKALPGR